MDIFRKVARNTLAQVFGRAGAVFTTVVTTAILTRLLGTTGYGTYVFIISLVLFFVAIADWGTGLISVREVVRNRVKEADFFGNIFLFRFLLAFIAFLLLNILAITLPQLKSFFGTIIIASFLLLLISIKTTCHIVFQARQRFEYMALIDMLISVLFLILLLLPSFLRSQDLTTVLGTFVLAHVVGVLVSLVLIGRMAQFNFVFNSQIIKGVFLEAMPTGALLLTFSIYNHLDIFLLQLLKGSDPVGIYGLAYKVYDNLILGAAYLASALFPVLSGLTGQGNYQDKLLVIYRKTFDILFIAGFAVLVGVFVFAPLIILIIGGPAFTRSVLALRILVFATFLAYFNHLTGYTLIVLGKQRISLLVAIIALIWNVTLNLILIPHYSFIAAAVVTIATEGLVLVLTSFYLARKFNLRPSLTFPQTLTELIKTRGKIF